MASGSEVVEYRADYPLYSLSWSCKEESPFRLAVGSFIEECTNKVEILNVKDDALAREASFNHPYPATSVKWAPSSFKTSSSESDLLGTTGDFLRIWEYKNNQVKEKTCLKTTQNSEFYAPLTSMDWSEADPKFVIAASIDTTCTIWNIENEVVQYQLIAHDKEVFDVAYALESSDIFTTCGNDGSVRLLDLRALKQSSIIYDSPGNIPLLRLAWNRQDPNLIATLPMGSSSIILLDVRVPSVPVCTLEDPKSVNKNTNINAFTWAPHSATHIATAGDNCQALIWDTKSPLPKKMEKPFLAYNAEAPISNIAWSRREADWIAIAFDDKVRMLKV